MYQLTRLAYTEIIDYKSDEYVLIELYIDYRTNKKYILNKVPWWDFAYVKEYLSDTLEPDSMYILESDKEDKAIYGPNPLAVGSWRIETRRYNEDYLTEIDIFMMI